MIDVEPLIRTELARVVPPPAPRADWDDVMRRSGGRTPRAWVVALAAAVAVLLAAAAVATTVDGFDDWLRGAPGKPASEQAQERFRAANGRSWASFPTSTDLRELVRMTVEGTEYVLYGFRSGNSLCLKVAADGEPFQPQACAPASFVANVNEPIVVVMGNFTFVDRAARPTAWTSFGIAADGVTRVVGHATDGTHVGIVGGNAYLFVATRPNTSTHMLRISAHSAGGRADVRVTTFHGGRATSSTGVAPGPTKVQARIPNPRIGWYERGERRGVSAEQVRLPAGARNRLRGARLVKPDPNSDFVVGLSGRYCLVTIRAVGCGTDVFRRGPLWAAAQGGYSSEFLTIYGAAADGVARVAVFLADGQRLLAPLRHNLFAAVVPTRGFPIRIVGYDARNRVVAIETGLSRFFGGARVPRAATRLRREFEFRGPNGAAARLLVGPRVRGFECWRFEFGSGAPVGECVGPQWLSSQLRVAAVRQVRNDLFVVGETNPAVRRVELRFSNGDKAVTRPVRAKFAFAVPREHLSRTRRRAFVVTFDGDGDRRGRQRIFFRLR